MSVARLCAISQQPPANRDRTVVKATADRHGQPNGPCEAAGKLSWDRRREIVEVRDKLSA